MKTRERIIRLKVARKREDNANNKDWFWAYQAVDDFLLDELGGDFPVTSESPEVNTIEAIRLVVRKRKKL